MWERGGGCRERKREREMGERGEEREKGDGIELNRIEVLGRRRV